VRATAGAIGCWKGALVNATREQQWGRSAPDAGGGGLEASCRDEPSYNGENRCFRVWNPNKTALTRWPETVHETGRSPQYVMEKSSLRPDRSAVAQANCRSNRRRFFSSKRRCPPKIFPKALFYQASPESRCSATRPSKLSAWVNNWQRWYMACVRMNNPFAMPIRALAMLAVSDVRSDG